MLVHRLRHWTRIDTALGEYLVFLFEGLLIECGSAFEDPSGTWRVVRLNITICDCK